MSIASRQEFLERQPTYWLKRTYQALRRTVDADLRPHGITLSQRDALLALRHHGPTNQLTLSESLGLEQSSVSRLIDGLVRRELVSIRKSQSDRRSRVVSLTEMGTRVLEATPGSSRLAGGLMAGALSQGEVTQLIDLLKRCTDVFETAAPVTNTETNPGPLASGPIRAEIPARAIKEMRSSTAKSRRTAT